MRRSVINDMHEAGIASQALGVAAAEAAAAGLTGRPPVGLDVVVDPGRAAPDAVAFHLELALRERGLEGIDVAVTSSSLDCPACGAPGSSDAWLLCEGCGAPLPLREGAIVEARFRY